jgi:hypothetical protein
LANSAVVSQLSNLSADPKPVSVVIKKKKKTTKNKTRCRWLTPIILATQEAKIRRITVQSQSGQTVCKTLSRKKPSQKKTGRVAYGTGPKFKPQYQ